MSRIRAVVPKWDTKRQCLVKSPIVDVVDVDEVSERGPEIHDINIVDDKPAYLDAGLVERPKETSRPKELDVFKAEVDG